MTDYEIEYQNHASACGEPFAEIENFFANCIKSPLRILDLGCGQGRDALMAASYGHSVLGIDQSPTGIRQMNRKAGDRGLDVVGKIADICDFRSSEKFEVVILDRVVHMLPSLEQKIQLLETAAGTTCDGGHILLVDTPKNLPKIDEFFASSADWTNVFRNKGFRFYRKSSSTA